MHQLSDDRIIKLNKWIDTVSTICNETNSFEDKNDIFTKWDKEVYHVVTYKDGTITRDLIRKDIPSIRLHKINSIIEGWGLKFSSITNWESNIFHWGGGSYINITLNTYHTDSFKITDGNWFTYDEKYIESIIDDYFIEQSKKSNNTLLKREVQLRSILGL